MKWVFGDGGCDKYFKGTAGDCVYRSIAIVTGMEYKEVYGLINKFIKEEQLDEQYISNA